MKTCKPKIETKTKIKKLHKEQKRKERKCFWSWPWGHCFHSQADGLFFCCGCDKIINSEIFIVA